MGTSHFGLSNSAPGQLNQVSTPAPTPNAGPDVSVGGKRGMKREREDGGGGGGPVVVNGNAGFSMPGGPVNGGMKSHHVGVSAKTASGVGSNGVRPRPVKKQRMVSGVLFCSFLFYWEGGFPLSGMIRDLVCVCG